MSNTANTDTKKSCRLFFALWPDHETRSALVQRQSGLSGRPTRADNLHLTLAFLGQQLRTQLPLLLQIAARLPQAPMQLLLDRYGYFSQHRIVYAGLQQTPQALLQLQQDLWQALQRQQITTDRSNTPPASFTPHVTLARAAAPLPPSAPEFAPILWHPARLVLVESLQQADGVCYRVLSA